MHEFRAGVCLDFVQGWREWCVTSENIERQNWRWLNLYISILKKSKWFWAIMKIFTMESENDSHSVSEIAFHETWRTSASITWDLTPISEPSEMLSTGFSRFVRDFGFVASSSSNLWDTHRAWVFPRRPAFGFLLFFRAPYAACFCHLARCNRMVKASNPIERLIVILRNSSSGMRWLFDSKTE